MSTIGTIVIYLVIGVAVGLAILIREDGAGRGKRVPTALSALLFWPLLAPTLVARPAKPSPASPPSSDRLEQLRSQLLAGFSGLPGLAEEVLAPELARVRSLDGAIIRMQQRLAEMDSLLATAEFDPAAAEAALAQLVARGLTDADPRRQSVQARLRNIERLRAMRAHTRDDLERVFLKLEEMGSQIQLLRFAGGSEAEAVQLLKDVASSVAEISEGLLSSEEAPASKPMASA